MSGTRADAVVKAIAEGGGVDGVCRGSGVTRFRPGDRIACRRSSGRGLETGTVTDAWLDPYDERESMRVVWDVPRPKKSSVVYLDRLRDVAVLPSPVGGLPCEYPS